MAFLAHVREQQGTAMGLFTTTSYLGMAVLPFLAGIIVDGAGFFAAFCCTAVAAVTVVVMLRKQG